MKTEHLIILVLFLHWLGDFVFQSDYMAKNKSKSNKVLAFHVSVYCLPLMLLGIKYAVFNALCHFFIDWLTSRRTSQLWKDGKVHEFFVVIGADQLCHATCLILLLNFR